MLNDLSADSFVIYDYNHCLTPSYTIPALIASLLDSADFTAHQISYGTFAKYGTSAERKFPGWLRCYAALGYDLPDLPTSVEAIYKLQPDRGTPAHNIPEFGVSTSNSFISGRIHLFFFANLRLTTITADTRQCPAHRETENRNTIVWRSSHFRRSSTLLELSRSLRLKEPLLPNTDGMKMVWNKYRVDPQSARFGAHLQESFSGLR